MRARLLLNLSALRAKYWLIPAVMALSATALAFALVALDRHVGVEWIENLPWIYANGPSGARSLLSTIAGSMITVAGVTFSITTAALATTAATFGARLITNFMQDRGNQITLGTFIATFVFCILVLRTVRTSDDSLTAFVPHLAIVVAVLFALASLGVLIYFIHHVPESIHISNILARLGRDLHAQVDEMFPDALGEPAGMAEDPVDADSSASGGRPVAARSAAAGYVQYIDATGLVKHAREQDLVIELRHRPGDFVGAESALAWIRPAARADQKVVEAVQGAIVVGGYRSQEQDVLYIVNRLVEVAARALSPGMNDIFTATNAMDWLGSGLAHLAKREIPEDARLDGERRLRIVARSRTFEEVAGTIFDQLRPYVAADRNAAVHLMQMLAAVARETVSLQRRAVLLMHAKALRKTTLEALDQPRDVEALEAAYGDVVTALSVPRVGAAASVEPELAGP